MKLLSALVLGGALLTGGCVQELEVDESPEEASKQDTDRKISNDELQNREGFGTSKVRPIDSQESLFPKKTNLDWKLHTLPVKSKEQPFNSTRMDGRNQKYPS